ncbi:hypothetical protein CEXT_194211 [Caerostris extrusa]|uniref:Uncharacterized protein n=1 Tax=Caerostris extrusa TaxID=172846 RepID=A0AAV4MKQ7_CAEEX|nr:hypothetical protein CEXT_194211 [Caerostris extrusa]
MTPSMPKIKFLLMGTIFHTVKDNPSLTKERNFLLKKERLSFNNRQFQDIDLTRIEASATEDAEQVMTINNVKTFAKWIFTVRMQRFAKTVKFNIVRGIFPLDLFCFSRDTIAESWNSAMATFKTARRILKVFNPIAIFLGAGKSKDSSTSEQNKNVFVKGLHF